MQIYCYLKDRTELPCKCKILPWQELGLVYNGTGHGAKIPTSYMVQYKNRWYRVYSICHSNVSTEYILVKGERVLVALQSYPY